MISTEMLRRFGFLADVGEEVLKQVAMISEIQDFEAGSVIFREGQPADFVYLVQDGEVDLKVLIGSGARRVVDTIVAGELLGWSAFVDPHAFHFDGIPRTNCTLIAVDSAKLRELMDRDPALGYRLMTSVTEVMKQRLEGARVQIAVHDN